MDALTVPQGRVPCRCGVLVQMVPTPQGSMLPLDLKPSPQGRLRPIPDPAHPGRVLADVVLSGQEHPGEPLWACHYQTCTAPLLPSPRLPTSQEVCPSCGEPMARVLAEIGLDVHPTCPPAPTASTAAPLAPHQLDLAS